MTYSVLELQRRLKALGFYSGDLDGIQGRLTNRAIVAFKKSRGLRARPYVGPVTEGLLFTPGAKSQGVGGTSLPPWMKIARSLIGTREIRGSRHNSKILRMWESAKLPFRDDETPWCAGFVGHCLEQTGFRSTRSAAARSYEKWEYGARLPNPVPGCIVTFWRGKRNGWSGHVGFVDAVDQNGRLMVLGGNQRNAVNVKPFSPGRVTGYFWPKGYPLPDDADLRRVVSHQASSRNEA